MQRISVEYIQLRRVTEALDSIATSLGLKKCNLDFLERFSFGFNDIPLDKSNSHQAEGAEDGVQELRTKLFEKSQEQ